VYRFPGKNIRTTSVVPTANDSELNEWWHPPCKVNIVAHTLWRAIATEDVAVSYRTFLDSTGKRWEVWLVTPAAAERRKVDRRVAPAIDAKSELGFDRRRTPERRRGSFRRTVTVASEFSDGWLCFESEGEKRRLAPVPRGWDEAGPNQMAVWLQAAKRVVKCGP
jgi:hypothetical protein